MISPSTFPLPWSVLSSWVGSNGGNPEEVEYIYFRGKLFYATGIQSGRFHDGIS